MSRETQRILIIIVAIITALSLVLAYALPSYGSINPQINFQGRLLTPSNAPVPDGNYNMEFKIYRDGDGIPGGGDETLLWTETRTGGNRVQVTQGYFSILLGAVNAFGGAVDWNHNVLWLSVQIGGTGGTPSWDGEMSPMKRLASVPQAFNADMVDGAHAGTGANQVLLLDSSGNVNIAGSIQSTAGSLSVAGTATIGTLGGAGATSLCRNASNQIASCAASVGTLQNAYNLGNTITTTNARDIAFTLSDTTTDSNFDIDIVAGNTVSISRLDNAVTDTPAQLLLVENLDTDLTIADGLRINVATGGVITDAIDVSDAEIVNAINVGDNVILGTTAVIDFTNFDVSSGGQLTFTGVATDITTASGENLTLQGAGSGVIELADSVTATGTLTFSGVATDLTTGTNEDLTLQAAGTGQIVLNDTVQIPTLDGTAGATALCRNASNLLATCTSNPSGVTLQQAYDAGNSITTTDNRNIVFTLADTTTDSDFIVNMQGTGNTIEFQDAGTAFFTASDGGMVLFRPTTNSTTSFRVQNSSGSATVLNVDSTNIRVGVNRTSPDTALHVVGSGVTQAGMSTIVEFQTSASAGQGVGAGIGLTGNNSGGGGTTMFAGILGAKENATAGDEAGYLAIYTRVHGGSLTEWFRVGSDGVVTVATLSGTTGTTSVCRNASNQLATCSGAGANTLQGVYDGGNTITTTDNRNIVFTLADTTTDSDFIVDMLGTGNTIEFRDGGTVFFTASDGGTVLFKPTTNSTTAFQIQPSSSSTPVFNVDTTNNRIGVNTNAPTESLEVHQGVILGTSGGTIEQLTGLAPDVDVRAVTVVGQYAYVGTATISGTTCPANCEFKIVDISRPNAPVQVGGLEIGAGVNAIAVAGRYAYLGNDDVSNGDFMIVDISNPASPTTVGTIHMGASGQRVRGVAVSGKYAYVVKDLAGVSGTFFIIDISNPSSPSSVFSTSGPGGSGANFLTVAVAGKYAYTGNATNGSTCGATNGCEFQIWDISNPSSASFVAGIDTAISVNSLYPSGRYVYAATDNVAGSSCPSQCEFKIFDVSNPSSPTTTGSLDLGGGNGNRVFAAGKYAYVAKGNSGITNDFVIIDVATPASPVEVGGADLGADGLAVATAGKFGFVGNAGVTGTCSGSTVTGCEFRVMDLPGLDVPTATLGTAAANFLQVFEQADFGQINVSRSVNVGIGGVQSQGPVSILTNTTGSSLNALEVRNSGGTLTFSLRDDGVVLFKPSTNSTTAFQIQPSASTTPVFNVNTTNSRIGIGRNDPQSTLDIVDIETTGEPFRIRRTASATSSYIFMGMSAVNGFGRLGVWDANASLPGNLVLAPSTCCQGGRIGVGAESPQAKLHVETNSSGLALFRVTDSTSTAVDVMNIDDEGAVTFRNRTNSTSAFIIQNAAGTGTVLNVDTTNQRVGIGSGTPSQPLDVEGLIQIDFGTSQSSVAVCHSGTAGAGTNNDVNLVDCTGTPSADYAEQYPTATDVTYGDLVVTGTDLVTTKDGRMVVKLVKSSVPYQPTVIGVVSDNYGDFSSIGYNVKEQDHPLPVALSGRVPVKATAENGPIFPGDPLTSSSTPGTVMKAIRPGRVVGLALSPLTEESGTVMVFVNPHWWHPEAEPQQTANSEQLTVGALTTDYLTVREAATLENNLTVKGDLVVEGLIRASDKTRGSIRVPSGATAVAVFWSRREPPAALTATPTWNTTIWVTNVSPTGATIHFGVPPTVPQDVYWIALD